MRLFQKAEKGSLLKEKHGEGVTWSMPWGRLAKAVFTVETKCPKSGGVNKGDIQSCTNYRGIKLMSYTMKLWERVVEHRLRKM
ncbi:hypothetical protein EJB05_44303, partial [Eragrostis curvula]